MRTVTLSEAGGAACMSAPASFGQTVLCDIRPYKLLLLIDAFVHPMLSLSISKPQHPNTAVSH